ncbi:MAG: PAS domain S-box protein [Candidatus Obscuribacterales bacterium]|nr:PAS domain S-box protein [Candidatus Obscuribacterales bacterium]
MNGYNKPALLFRKVAVLKQANPGDLIRSLSGIFALLVMALGLSVGFGWIFGIEFLKNPFPDEGPVAMSSALCLILSGTALLAKKCEKRFLYRLLVSLVLAICSFILAHYLFDSFDLDRFLDGKELGPLGPNRMAPSILFSFMSVNIAILLDAKRHRFLIDFLVLFSSALCLTAFTAHFFDVPQLMQVRTIIQMASPTALAGLLMGFSLLCQTPSDGFISLLAGTGLGGRFARHYLFAAIFLPYGLGKLALHGVQSGWYDVNFGSAMIVLIIVSSLISIIWMVAHWLDEAELRANQAQDQMRRNMENTRLIVDSVSDAFIMVNGAGQLLEWNPAAEKLLGWTKAEVLGRSFEFIIDESEREMHMRGLVEYRLTGHSDKLNNRMEIRLLRKDGSSFPAEGSPFAISSAGEELLGAFWHDISLRKESEKRINEFISTVSHELRTPLTSIKGALRLIEGGVTGEVTPEAMSLVNMATSETERLVRLVNDILDLKKIEAGKLELKFESVEVGSLVDEAIEGISGMAADFGIGLKKEVFFSGKISCDKDRILQVLANLLSNAIKFSPEGESVSLSLSASAGFLRFSVCDNGCGIPESQVHKLFGRFQQLDSSDSRQQGGTGLGLAISKAIVEQHHGEIGLESRYGEGSIFWFDLPLSVNLEESGADDFSKLESLP